MKTSTQRALTIGAVAAGGAAVIGTVLVMSSKPAAAAGTSPASYTFVGGHRYGFQAVTTIPITASAVAAGVTLDILTPGLTVVSSSVSADGKTVAFIVDYSGPTVTVPTTTADASTSTVVTVTQIVDMGLTPAAGTTTGGTLKGGTTTGGKGGTTTSGGNLSANSALVGSVLGQTTTTSSGGLRKIGSITLPYIAGSTYAVVINAPAGFVFTKAPSQATVQATLNKSFTVVTSSVALSGNKTQVLYYVRCTINSAVPPVFVAGYAATVAGKSVQAPTGAAPASTLQTTAIVRPPLAPQITSVVSPLFAQLPPRPWSNPTLQKNYDTVSSDLKFMLFSLTVASVQKFLADTAGINDSNDGVSCQGVPGMTCITTLTMRSQVNALLSRLSSQGW